MGDKIGKGLSMQKNPVSEFILDRLASGASFKDLQTDFNISKKELISAALYGVAELRHEYMTLLARKYRK
jgi:hypothetical protein